MRPTTITARLRRAAWILVLGLAAVAACVPPRTALHPRYAEPIGQIHVRRGRLSWGALVIGMSFQEVQRVLGRRLPTPSEPSLACGYRDVEAEVQDQPLVLQFEGGGETGRLAAIALVLPGASTLDLAATLEARFPELEYVPSRHAPDLAESANTKPLYRLPEEEGGGLFFIDPRVGLWLGRACVE